ncbi:LacI family DNA-binding transcriptional regulator [Bacillus sp. JJ722]|uniref:LacI family DNA-binding transcriptional regulator n=1 Tax=Bacillus sp. JJ722 TaxID=3122973 RepID=UPI002FFFEE91
MNYTIYDIAKIANVSKSTVSRVLNNQGNTSEIARQRVLKAIEELNYQPSKLARGLSTAFDAIMVLSRPTSTTTKNPYFSEIIHIISQRAELENFDVILQTSKNSTDTLNKCVNKIKEKMIKGIVMLSSPSNEEFFIELDKYNVPVVVIGKIDGHYTNIFSVDTDNYQDSYNLCTYLIEQGHEKIACIHAPLQYNVSIDRLHGYQDCLRDHDLPLIDPWIMDGGYTIEDAQKSLQPLLSMSKMPTAIFATDDSKVVSSYKFALDNGLEIPDDLSIAGYGNSNTVPYLNPPLTRIEIPFDNLGQTAMDLLFNKIKINTSVPLRTILPTKMWYEQSVANKKTPKAEEY